MVFASRGRCRPSGACCRTWSIARPRGAVSWVWAAVRLLVLVWVAAGYLTVSAARACIAVGLYTGSIGIPLVERYS